MTVVMTAYCDVCKTETPRCEYYPAGRSRQHGKCLTCDRNDIRNPRPNANSASRYCGDCENNYLASQRGPQ